MAVAADAAGLVRHAGHTVTLTGEGQARGATLTPPQVRKSGGRPSAKLPAPMASNRLSGACRLGVTQVSHRIANVNRITETRLARYVGAGTLGVAWDSLLWF